MEAGSPQRPMSDRGREAVARLVRLVRDGRKPMIVGCTAGKFYPPHIGHQHVINVAKQQCDIVLVLVCDRPGDEFSGAQRASWIDRENRPSTCWKHSIEWCKKRLGIVCTLFTADDIPNDSKSWGKRMLEVAKSVGISSINFTFGAEKYHYKWAEYMGATHIPVDRPVGTPEGRVMRENLSRNWKSLLSPAKQDLCVLVHFVQLHKGVFDTTKVFAQCIAGIANVAIHIWGCSHLCGAITQVCNSTAQNMDVAYKTMENSSNSKRSLTMENIKFRCWLQHITATSSASVILLLWRYEDLSALHEAVQWGSESKLRRQYFILVPSTTLQERTDDMILVSQTKVSLMERHCVQEQADNVAMSHLLQSYPLIQKIISSIVPNTQVLMLCAPMSTINQSLLIQPICELLTTYKNRAPLFYNYDIGGTKEVRANNIQ